MREQLPRARALFGASVTLAFCLGACQEAKPTYDPPDLVQDIPEPQDLPPVSGGTMLVTPDEKRVVAADPDQDMIWIARLDLGELEHAITLEKGDEPGRVVLGSEGRVHVVLRGAGEVAMIDPVKGEVLRRTPVCVAPRGIAHDEATGLLHVVCAGGELLAVSAEDGAIQRSANLGPDLRDVVVQGSRLLVSRLRSAELLAVDAYGAVLDTARPPVAVVNNVQSAGGGAAEFSPTVAWRMIPLAGGGALVAHQRSQDASVTTTSPGGYYGHSPCDTIVHGAVSRFDVAADGHVAAPPEAYTRLHLALPVDVAVSGDGSVVAVVGAGSNNVSLMSQEQLLDPAADGCNQPAIPVSGMPVAVGFAGEEVVIQTRAPAAILVPSRDLTIQFSVTGHENGHKLFHVAPAGTVACASCHPEGREDGHTWNFTDVGPRRSQSLRARVSETLPLHWNGDLDDIGEFMDVVFVNRMGGAPLGDSDKVDVRRWLDGLPMLPALRDPEDEAAVRGRELFERDDVGCASCHEGELFTNNRNEPVGKGDGPALQVPSLLGVGWRAPLMHDGCAATLRDRFDPACGGDAHGDVSMLDEGELDDLIAYLESI